MTVPKVAIGIPYYKHWEGRFGMCAMDLAMRSAASCAMLPIECTGAYIEDNRNGAVKFALEYEAQAGIQFDWMFWMDTDMIFPGDALLRLIAHDKDIVGANYRQRRPPYGFTGHYLDGQDTQLLEPGLHRMGHLATGLLLVRFDIYRKLPYPWFDAALVSEKPRDDVYFCRKAVEAGYEIWCDHDLTFQVRHIGEQEIEWFNSEQIRPLIAGAEINMKTSSDIGHENVAAAVRQAETARDREAAYREAAN